ncbi:MAG: metallophosphoesterase [Myxococcota bacterium]
MTNWLPWLFPLLAVLTAVTVPLYAGWMRGRRYGVFSAITLGVSLPGALIGHARLVQTVPESVVPWLHLAFAYCMAAAGVHLAHLVRARMRSPWFRLGASVPGQTFVAAGFMMGGWLLALLPIRALFWALSLDGVLAVLRPLDWLPLIVAAASAISSPRPSIEWVRVRLGVDGPEEVTRVPVERHRLHPPAPLEPRPLRLVQITDPHLGPWQTIGGLQRTIERLLDRDPDLVLLTGDFLTMESNATPGALATALEPLGELPGRCFAIFGNHDHEAPDEVRHGLESNGVRLLVDEEVACTTAAGRVQLIGADYVGKGRREHLLALLEKYPRREDHLRLLMLHDPLGFRHLPADDVDLTLSGHTHGGQVGLVSLGLDWTVLSRSRWPDHGLFALGANRLYVHRGTGFYGFPLRVGVPGEASVLEVLA